MMRQRNQATHAAHLMVITGCMFAILLPAAHGQLRDQEPVDVARPLVLPSGIDVVLGISAAQAADSQSMRKFLDMYIQGNRHMVYIQSPNIENVSALRQVGEEMGILGSRLFVEQGDWKRIHLADNLADRVTVLPAAIEKVSREEVLRVLCPRAVATLGEEKIVKPVQAGTDSWSHPYHGPDNNPQSTDQLARAPYRTQFLAKPLFSPMPEVSVAAGGRLFKAFGHIAHKANQNAMLNTLLCVNAHNGTELWRRPLHPGFMIHRNTMIATPDTLYLGDNESCKVIDARTGKNRDEIRVPAGVSDGPVWKWMALQNGILYALVGHEEIHVDTVPSSVRGLGHWPWGMWKGHDYSDPRTSFGFGRTFIAIDLRTKKLLWSYRDAQYLDSRGVCMGDNRIYFYSPGEFLGCLDAINGKPLWKNRDDALLQAIGPNGRAQHYVTGYATTAYIKCTDARLFFAGPQRSRLVVASTEDGRLLWQKRGGNLQLVLRDDGVYCAGPGSTGVKFSYEGQQLLKLPTRRACTRATGSIDSIFYRTSGGTVRVDVASNTASHIAPMRPPCQDGVIISDGQLFWGPWMCGCQLSLYGNISLAPAGSSSPGGPDASPQLQENSGEITRVARFNIDQDDWTAYQHDAGRSATTRVQIPASLRPVWTYRLGTDALPTAPVFAGETVFIADRVGVVRALDADGNLVWKTHTGGAIYFPPTIADDRLFVGSADGRVYALEAATGRLLWSYRMAPQSRWIPVYGKLMSTWPVAGGVAVREGIVYAAAGIAHYDGTYVVALDAKSGKLLWQNDSSGALAPDVDCGISLQGNLRIQNNELQFPGGGAYHTARFDLATGECLNAPRSIVTSQFATAFYAYFPTYGKYASLVRNYPDGRTLAYLASYDGVRFTPLGLAAPKSATKQLSKPVRDVPRRDRRAEGPRRRMLWQHKQGMRYTAFVAGPETLLAAGESTSGADSAVLHAVRIKDGSQLWTRNLPGVPVKGGMAIDHRQQVVIVLEDGQILCLAPGQDK